MNRNFLIIEKIIATFLVIYGCIYLYSTILMVSALTRIAVEQNIAKSDFLFLKISKGYYLSILGSSLAVLGGFLLFLGKKIGWAISLIASFLFGLQLLTAIIKAYSLNNEHALLISVRIFMAILFFAITFCLILRPFRIKYNMLLKS